MSDDLADGQRGPLPDGHLGDEQLFDLAAGLPSPGADQHLAGCPSCRAAVAEQTRAAAALRSLGDADEPMPADLADRIDAALAAAGNAQAGPVGDLLPMAPARERRDSALVRVAQSRLAKGVVGVAAAGLIGIGGYAALHNNTAGGSRANGSAASSAGGGSSVAAPQSDSQKEAAGRVLTSGFDYTKANVAGEVTKLLGSVDTAKTPAAQHLSEATTLTTPAGLRSCLQALEAPNAVPLLVDVATFDGKPAAVVVLPGDTGSGRQIWVVSPTCAPDKDGVIYFANVP